MDNWEVTKQEPLWEVAKQESISPSLLKRGYENITKPFKAQAIKTAEALNVGLASFSQNLDELSQYVGSKLGIADRSGIFEKASKFYLNNAEYLNEKAKEIGTNKVDEIVGEAVGGAVPGISEFMLGVPYYALSGAKEASKRGDSEIIGAVTEGTQRYVMGKVLNATGILKQPLRSPVMGGVFAATAPEGERAKAFGVGALYGIAGPKAGGQVGIREIREGLKKKPTVTPITKTWEVVQESKMTETDLSKAEEVLTKKKFVPVKQEPLKPEEQFLQPIELKEAKPKPTPQELPLGAEKEALKGKIPTEELPITPLERAAKETETRKVEAEMAEKQIGIPEAPSIETKRAVLEEPQLKLKIKRPDNLSGSLAYVKTGKLSEMIEYPELFEAFPELKDVPTKISIWDRHTEPSGLYGRSADRFGFTGIQVFAPKEKETLFAISHELRHALQEIKGLSRIEDFAEVQKLIEAEMAERQVGIPENIIPYDKDLKITNIEQLAKGRGLNYLEVIQGKSGAYIAKQWRQKPTSTGTFIKFEPIAKPSQPTNIITWIKSKGGIDYVKEEWGGEIDMAMENQPTLKSAVNMKGGGRTLDELTQMGLAEGWIKEDSPQALLDAIEKKLVKPSLMEERIARQGPGAVMAGGIAFESNLPKYAININLDRIDNTYAIKKTILDISDKYATEIDEARRGKISLEETRKMADTLGMIEKKLLNRRKGQAFSAEEALASRDYLNASAQRLRDIQIKAAQLGTDEALATFRMYLEYHAGVQAQVSGMTAEAGRALSSFRIMSKARESKAYKSMLDAMGGRELNEEILRKFAQIDPTNITAVNKFIREATKAKTLDMVYEAWISAILSGPKTHAVNLTSNALTFLTKPLLEDPTVATLEVARGAITGKQRERYFREIPYQVFGMWNGLKEGIKAATKAWQTEMPSEVGEKIELTVRQAIPSKTVKIFGKEFEIGGKQIRIPLRALLAADEFGKAVIYRSEINSQAYRMARKERLKGDKLVNRIAELQQDPTPNMIESARKEARYRTFNQPLGNIGNQIMRLRNTTPLLKYIIPFIRTPANIAKFALERTPLNFARLAYKVSKGEIPETQLSEEFAKPIMGSLIAAAVIAWAKEGFITGSGPKDKEDREALYRIGWQPYSFKIADKYWSYARLEPMGSIVGMSADFAEMFTGEEKDINIANKITYSFSRNIASKTFLSGLVNAMDAISDPQRYGDQWINQFAGSVVPTGVAQYTQATDETLRKAETPLEKIKSRIPELSKELLPRRDIWGKEIKKEGTFAEKFVSPMAVSTAKPDFIDNEIVRLKLSIGMPAKKISNVELTSKEYDEYSEKAGRRARQIVERIMKTPSYHIQRDEIKKLRIENAIKTARIAEGSKMLKTMERERRQKPIKEKYGLR